MKKLQTSDIFAALRIVKAANLKEDLKPIISKAATGNVGVEDIGIEAILTMIEGAAEKKCENAVYDFLAAPFEMNASEVAELSICDLAEKLKELAKENDLANFFKSLSDLMSLKSLT